MSQVKAGLGPVKVQVVYPPAVCSGITAQQGISGRQDAAANPQTPDYPPDKYGFSGTQRAGNENCQGRFFISGKGAKNLLTKALGFFVRTG